VNLFTEEHAALTGSRDVIVPEELKPERSYNANLNYLKKIYTNNGNFIGLETTAWYTHFFQIPLFQIMIAIQTKLSIKI
jgi:outer membrane receptor for ferrienterochelin and colicins